MRFSKTHQMPNKNSLQVTPSNSNSSVGKINAISLNRKTGKSIFTFSLIQQWIISIGVFEAPMTPKGNFMSSI